MSKRWFLISLGLFFFLQFVFFSFLVHKNLFTQADFNNTVILQDHMPRRFDNLFSTFSDIGKVEPMSLVITALLIFFILRKKFLAGFSMMALFIGMHVIELYGKYFVSHRPPPEFMLRTKQIFTFPQFTVREQNSYPSGHSGRALFISTILIIMILQSRRLSSVTKIILCGLVIVYDITMLVSRVYLGEHWTSDVIGGSLLGMSFGLFTGLFLLGKNRGEEKTKEKRKGLFPKFKVEIKRLS